MRQEFSLFVKARLYSGIRFFSTVILLLSFLPSAFGQPEIKPLFDHEKFLCRDTRGYAKTGSMLFFYAQNNFGNELWVYDEVLDSAYMVRDIFPGSGSGIIGGSSSYGATVNDLFVFPAQNYQFNRELWVSDGTSSGTKLLKEIEPSGESIPSYFRNVGDGTVIFDSFGKDSAGYWLTDGTAEGTSKYEPGKGLANNISYDKWFYDEVGDRYFVWQNYTDSLVIRTAKGDNLQHYATVQNQLVINATNKFMIAYVNDRLIMNAAADDGRYEMFAIKQNEDAVQITESRFQDPLSFGILGGDKFMGFANDSTHGKEPWITDGTVEGTHLLYDITPGVSSRTGYAYLFHKDKFYFSAEKAVSGKELWISNGTTEGTMEIASVEGQQGLDPSYLVVMKELVYFVGHSGTSISYSNGTAEGTNVLFSVADSSVFKQMANLTVMGDTLLFTALLGRVWYFVPGDACELIDCPEGFICYDGECIPPDPCIGVTCPISYECDNGTCVYVDRCADTECGIGEVCYGGACYPTMDVIGPDDICSISCNEGQVCVEGSCFDVVISVDSTELCQDVVCPEGFECYMGECIDFAAVYDTTDLCEGIVCGEEQTCVSGACYDGMLLVLADDLCADVQCGAGEVCYEGACYYNADIIIDSTALCEGVSCDEGEICFSGGCYPIEEDVAQFIGETASTGIVFYPNPSSGLVYFRSDAGIPDLTVNVYNVTGQAVASRTFSEIQPNEEFELTNFIDLPAGMYFIHLSGSISGGQMLYYEGSAY